MRGLEQGIKRIVAQEVARVGAAFFGTVMAVSPDGLAVRLMRMPEGVPTGWLPIVRAAGGAQAGGAVPQAGWLAFAVPDRNDAEQGVVIGFAHTTAQPLPAVPDHAGTLGVANTTAAPYAAGEIVIVGPGSNVIRMNADGTIYIKGGITVEGDLRVNGDISDRYGKINDFRLAYNSHTHPDPQGGNTSPPSPQVVAS